MLLCGLCTQLLEYTCPENYVSKKKLPYSPSLLVTQKENLCFPSIIIDSTVLEALVLRTVVLLSILYLGDLKNCV